MPFNGNKKIYAIGLAVGLALLVGVCSGLRRDRSLDVKTSVVERGPLQVWISYAGDLESRDVHYIFSKIGPSTVVDLVPEGAQVHQGDQLVQMDSSSLDRDLLRLEKEKALADAELTSLERAQIPQQISELEMKQVQAQSDLELEENYLKDSRQLMKDGLVAEAEVDLQKKKVDSLKAQERGIEEQLRLTREYLHPAALAKAKASALGGRQAAPVLVEAGARRAHGAVDVARVAALQLVEGLAVGRVDHRQGVARQGRNGSVVDEIQCHAGNCAPKPRGRLACAGLESPKGLSAPRSQRQQLSKS